MTEYKAKFADKIIRECVGEASLNFLIEELLMRGCNQLTTDIQGWEFKINIINSKNGESVGELSSYLQDKMKKSGLIIMIDKEMLV